jgi:hypothetical protein
MPSVKRQVIELVGKLPDDCSLEDIQYHLYVRQKIAKGLQAAAERRVQDHAEVKQRLGKWLTR